VEKEGRREEVVQGETERPPLPSLHTPLFLFTKPLHPSPS
jgi:hypothetical protein